MILEFPKDKILRMNPGAPTTARRDYIKGIYEEIVGNLFNELKMMHEIDVDSPQFKEEFAKIDALFKELIERAIKRKYENVLL